LLLINLLSDAFDVLHNAALLDVKALWVPAVWDVAGHALGQRSQFSGEVRPALINILGCLSEGNMSDNVRRA
jgi:hypothetical protein